MDGGDVRREHRQPDDRPRECVAREKVMSALAAVLIFSPQKTRRHAKSNHCQQICGNDCPVEVAHWIVHREVIAPETFCQTRINTTPWRGTEMLKEFLNLPKSFCRHRSRTCNLPLSPRSDQLTVTWVSVSPRLNRPTAFEPSAKSL